MNERIQELAEYVGIDSAELTNSSIELFARAVVQDCLYVIGSCYNINEIVNNAPVQNQVLDRAREMIQQRFEIQQR